MSAEYEIVFQIRRSKPQSFDEAARVRTGWIAKHRSRP